MREERDGPSVRANETFEIIILADREVYKIALNGRHLGEFRHRLPLHLVHFIHVSGDVTIDYILFEQDMSSTSSIPDQIGVSQFATPSAPVMPMPPLPMNVHINNPGGQPYQHPPPSYFNQQPSSYPVSLLKNLETLTYLSLLFLATTWKAVLVEKCFQFLCILKKSLNQSLQTFQSLSCSSLINRKQIGVQ